MKPSSLALLVGSVFVSTSFEVEADRLSFGLQDKSASVAFAAQVAPQALVTSEYLYHTDNGSLFDVGLHATHKKGVHELGVGGKLVAAFGKQSRTGQALAFGGLYRAAIIRDLYVGASAYYSPTVLGFGDVSRHLQWDANLEYALMPNASLMLGYREVKMEFDSKPKLTLTDGFYLGLALQF